MEEIIEAISSKENDAQKADGIITMIYSLFRAFIEIINGLLSAAGMSTISFGENAE